MPEEPSAPTAASEQATASAAAPTDTAAPSVDYNALLDQIPEDVLTRHRRFNGYVGSHAQRLAAVEQERRAREESEKAVQAKMEELEREAEENPFAFAARWKSDRARERAQLELSELRTNTQRQLFAKIGESYGAIPEWQQLTPDEFAKVQRSVVGASDDELIGRFNAAALDVLADRRAEQKARERVEAEVEARLQQMRGENLRGETTPSMDRPVSANGISDASAIRGMSDAEFNAYYQRTFRT